MTEYDQQVLFNLVYYWYMDLEYFSSEKTDNMKFAMWVADRKLMINLIIQL